MRTQEEIEDRLRALLVAELDRRMLEAAVRLPVKCKHNYRQPLDTRRSVDGEKNPSFNRITSDRGLPVVQTMGLCMLGADKPEDWQGTICEDAIDAQRCPFFDPKVGKEQVWNEFNEDISSPGWVAQHMPQINELRWILADDSEVRLPWWKKILFRFARIRIPKPLPPFNPDKLLPPPNPPG
jgi:hypothetical protein